MSAPEDHSAEAVSAGLEDARAVLADIWRRNPNDAQRKRAMRALRAVISAEEAMRLADALLLAKPGDRQAAWEALRVSCCLRVGHDVRKNP